MLKPSRLKTYNVSAEVEDEVYTLYTCPANCSAQMNLLFLANANGNTSVNVGWYRVQYDDTFSILGGKNLVSGDFIQFSDAVIVFEAGDYLTVQATGNATPDIDVLCTVEETFKPVG